MAELTMTTFVTLDGVMQAPGGPDEDRSGGFEHGGWLVPHFDDDMAAIIDRIFRKADAFLLGRRTWDIFAAYWPKMADPADPVASKLNTLPKHVASRSKSDFPWSGSEVVRDVVKEIPAIKQRYQGELQVHGSGDLAQTLIAHDLVDEYRLLTFPVVLGAGRRLFGSGARPANLTLVETTSAASGMIYAVYRRGQPFRTGTFDFPPDEER